MDCYCSLAILEGTRITAKYPGAPGWNSLIFHYCRHRLPAPSIRLNSHLRQQGSICQARIATRQTTSIEKNVAYDATDTMRADRQGSGSDRQTNGGFAPQDSGDADALVSDIVMASFFGWRLATPATHNLSSRPQRHAFKGHHVHQLAYSLAMGARDGSWHGNLAQECGLIGFLGDGRTARGLQFSFQSAAAAGRTSMEGGRGQLFAGHGDSMRAKARGRPISVLQHAGDPNASDQRDQRDNRQTALYWPGPQGRMPLTLMLAGPRFPLIPTSFVSPYAVEPELRHVSLLWLAVTSC
ncbi:hypothetical protein V8C44DRAFT_72627 [Trichoderma aethiopicum]